MRRLTSYFVLPLLISLLGFGALYVATDGRLDRHFHGSIADRSQQASIHPVVLNSGFHLRQAIETKQLDHIPPRLRNAPICIWLRMEYPRDAANWTTTGTVELHLSTPMNSWSTQFKSEQITTYFQPFCFRGSQAEALFDRPTELNIAVVEPGLERVALIALGPGNGQNNAEINGETSEYTASYILTADPGPSQEDMARYALIALFSLALLLTILVPLTGRTTRPTPIHTSSHPQEGNNS